MSALPYARLDDQYAEHPKNALLSDRAFRAQTWAICYSNRVLTDGFLPGQLARVWGMPAVRELLKTHWDEAPGGYSIRGYLDWNPSKEQVIEARAKKAAAAHARWNAPAEQTHKQTHKQTQSDSKAIASPAPTPKDQVLGAPPPSANGAGRRDEFFEATVAVCQIPPEGLTESARKRAGKFAAEVRRAGGDPPLIRGFGVVWREAHPDIPVNLGLLINHWPDYMAGALQPLPPRRRG